MPQPQARARTSFPPEPWRLKGEVVFAGWLLPAPAAPLRLPRDWRPLRLFGRVVLGAMWASYGPGGDLAYRELAVGVVVRKGWRLGVTVPWIWVDSARSRAGGRALWAIPKELARFKGLSARDLDGRWIASAETGRWTALPGRWPFHLVLVQPDGEAGRQTPARLTGRVAFGRSRWRTAAPLPLVHRPPLLTVRLERARLRFGSGERPR